MRPILITLVTGKTIEVSMDDDALEKIMAKPTTGYIAFRPAEGAPIQTMINVAHVIAFQDAVTTPGYRVAGEK